ncbi:hypothetical protein TrRE_jg10875 [Triparma retinervis]|uniref:Uncharacterized protein n=1 Tax=Triparma retinervis TaxID=2557542 RepID=A0A9W7AM38_9STRA|nr:hypothetical protein TrRE_jg10875 [Triparma retinervis]
MALNKIDSIAIAFCANATNTGDSGIFGSAIKLFQTTHKHLLHPSYDGRISDEARESLKALVYNFYELAVFPALLYIGDDDDDDDDDEEWSWGDLNPLEFLPPNNKFVPVPPFRVWLQKRGDNIPGMVIMSEQIKEEVDLVDVTRWDAWNKNVRGPCISTGEFHGFVSIEHTIVNVISTNRLSTYANMGIEPLRNNSSVDLRNVAKQLLKTVREAKQFKTPQVHVLGGHDYKNGLMCYLCGKERQTTRTREGYGQTVVKVNQVYYHIDIIVPPYNNIVRVSRCQSCQNLCIILKESLAVDLNGPRNEISTDDSDYFVMQVAIKLDEYARISF